MDSQEKRRFRILDERTVARPSAAGIPTPADTGAENPYWLAEEPAPHPDPSRGCIRRTLCCRSSPGWFAPGEVEQAAALRDMSPDEFVQSFIIVDGAEVDGQWVDVFAPVKLDRNGAPALPPATRVDALYRSLRGVCIFFDGAGCGIYAARPVECREYDCTNPPDANPTHADIARKWLDAARSGED